MTEFEKSKYLLWNYPVDRQFESFVRGFRRVGLFDSHQSAVNSVLNHSNKIAIIDNDARNKYLAGLNCDLKVVGKPFTRRPYAIAVPNGSPLRDRINYACVFKIISSIRIYTLEQQKLSRVIIIMWIVSF